MIWHAEIGCHLDRMGTHYELLKLIPTGDGKESSGRIAGGAEVTPNSLPYHVGLSCAATVNEADCGGALITPNFVLSGE